MNYLREISFKLKTKCFIISLVCLFIEPISLFPISDVNVECNMKSISISFKANYHLI